MTLQTTLSRAVSCTGIGLHQGVDVTLRLLPAKADSGILFRRADVANRRHALIPARYDLVAETRLGTTLRNAHGVSVSTVEHLMAALWGMGVDNAVVELSAPEVPIMDGSSEPFIALIREAGLRRLPEPRRIIRVLREVAAEEGEAQGRVQPCDGFALDVEIDFPHPLIARQRACYDFSDTGFGEALAAARTFGFAHEVEALRARGLARGGSLDNAIVLGSDAILNEGGLRYPDEFIRHKALDCVGDLYLAGPRIEGLFTFRCPGHGINNRLLRALMADRSAWKLVSTQPAHAPAPAPALVEAQAAYL